MRWIVVLKDGHEVLSAVGPFDTRAEAERSMRDTKVSRELQVVMLMPEHIRLA